MIKTYYLKNMPISVYIDRDQESFYNNYFLFTDNIYDLEKIVLISNVTVYMHNLFLEKYLYRGCITNIPKNKNIKINIKETYDAQHSIDLTYVICNSNKYYKL